MSDQDENNKKSWLLYNLLNRIIGSQEMVVVKRRMTIMGELIANADKTLPVKRFNTGSRSEGSAIVGSDKDFMFIYKNVTVICPNQDTGLPQSSADTSVLLMRDTADSRPGYVTLQFLHRGGKCPSHLMASVVPVLDQLFVSSEVYQRIDRDMYSNFLQIAFETNGPASALTYKDNKESISMDTASSLHCPYWPKEANEWVSRPRLHEWPDKALRDQIVQGGCQLVPVGDKTSDDSFLQWRISFVTAERHLIYSLSHVQFLVYGLLKYFIKQISGILKQLQGDTDILTSYILKTAVFHAVENTHHSLWQEKNLFYCFMLCMKMLIGWVETGYCPNYFIQSNNMFHGKLNVENQQKLLRFLIDIQEKKWECLSVKTITLPTIGQIMHDSGNLPWESALFPPTTLERKHDLHVFRECCVLDCGTKALPASLNLLSGSKSELDDFFAYVTTAVGLSNKGQEIFGEYFSATGNKNKYKYLRRCKTLLKPFATACTSSGLLTLATYYYLTGNNLKTLAMCKHVITSDKLYLDCHSEKQDKKYEDLHCGRGYTLLNKFREAWLSDIHFSLNAPYFCPSRIQPELTLRSVTLSIPPLPYAVFLSFQCYHELGETRRRDEALVHLRAVKYDEEQGGDRHWIVHNLLGICYEMIEDKQRALRSYRDSLGVLCITQYKNQTKKRIERLLNSQKPKE
ncbi:uncharacterized protein LOC132555197 [Ylistrum balloti]|uniref:uncharacterized protein LOC132555197 n=1 Tax=Ylistrum balloti TaxID=509963 RepID=UPI002905F346|nr:uncharacterized protein LOC132555197 [Ylistrum balloti]